MAEFMDNTQTQPISMLFDHMVMIGISTPQRFSNAKPIAPRFFFQCDEPNTSLCSVEIRASLTFQRIFMMKSTENTFDSNAKSRR